MSSHASHRMSSHASHGMSSHASHRMSSHASRCRSRRVSCRVSGLLQSFLLTRTTSFLALLAWGAGTSVAPRWIAGVFVTLGLWAQPDRALLGCQGIDQLAAQVAGVAAGSVSREGKILTRDEAPLLQPLQYHNPELMVDLGVGLWAWPIPWDVDGDGDYDLLVACPDQPSNGVWFFENISGDTREQPLPVFRPGVKLSSAVHYLLPSYVDGQLRVLSPGYEYPDFVRSGTEQRQALNVDGNFHQRLGRQAKGPGIRHRQWSYVDYDGDGPLDLIIAIEDWSDYGWDDAYDASGNWSAGPLHGLVYWLRNLGSTEQPQYAPPQLVHAQSGPIDVYGCPTPQFVDWDGDGDLDLICGEFLDGLTYFQNIGTRTEPVYADGVRLRTPAGQPLKLDLQMIVPIAFDWNRDGHVDLIVGDEDGRVAWLENTGTLTEDKLPQFLPPVYFQQQAHHLKSGALSTPVGVDWDGDGDWDLLVGNTAGYIDFFENLSGPGITPPRWNAPRRLQVEGRDFRIQAGPNGSIQGPAEAKWGYTTLSVGDWDGDGRVDLMVNSIWGQVVWLRNLGPDPTCPQKLPRLAPPQPVLVDWPQDQRPKPEWVWWLPPAQTLVTQWRTTPVMVDWDGDGSQDLVMLDPEGFLALYPRRRTPQGWMLGAPERIFHGLDYRAMDARHRILDPQPGPLQLNQGRAGASGRRKLTIVDWDGDGRQDVLVNSANAHWLRNESQDNPNIYLRDRGPLSDRDVQGHSTSPTTVDFDGDGRPELILGAEDGRIYYQPRERQP